MLKARMTIIPARFSRVTRLSRSTSFWIILNFGRETEKTIETMPIRTTTARAMIHHMEELLPTARMMPPTPMIGA